MADGMLFASDMIEADPRADPVVVTGIGMVTALGNDVAANVSGFRAGRIGLREVTLFDVSRQRAGRAGQVELPAAPPATLLDPAHAASLDRSSRLLLHAAAECLATAGWSARPQRLDLSIATSSGGMAAGEQFFRDLELSPPKRAQRRRIAQYTAHRQLFSLCEAFGIEGNLLIPSNACASGCNAIGEAWRSVRCGHSRRMLAGGYDALSQLVFAGFDSLQALSLDTPRPFDVARDGLALGEGAAVLALERRADAIARGARIFATISGYAAATDLHHLTQPHPDGATALGTMREACRAAGLSPRDIGYVNAHGTGTRLNDAAELRAINDWAGDAAGDLMVSSTKAGIGHLLGAAGAIETALCALAVDGRWLPPNANLDNPEPDAEFQLPTECVETGIQHALSNSFGFGGSNASIIVSRHE